ncbi:MAG TPA: hypothetical protein VFR08_02485, partial [Candidatus Angelobacter sp.]|nr:hypothetical protein [Candidatus Angelobacter sp.]
SPLQALPSNKLYSLSRFRQFRIIRSPLAAKKAPFSGFSARRGVEALPGEDALFSLLCGILE